MEKQLKFDEIGYWSEIKIDINPPFKRYHFVDLDELKVEALEQIAGIRNDIFT